jgi:hypothetical protein
MTLTEIETLFQDTIQKRGFSKDLNGISKDVIYNWRNGRGKNPPTTGQMLDVLWQLGKIDIHKNNSKNLSDFDANTVFNELANKMK